MENRRLFVLFISVFFGCVSLMAEKSELHQRAEAEAASHHVASARSLYIRAFEGYVAKGQMEDMEKGFRAGTDDYMVKPIQLRELMLRVGALLRLAQLMSEKRLTIRGTVLDYASLTVQTGEQADTLPPKEFYLLFKLLNQPGKIFTRQELLDEIWGVDKDTDSRNVDAHIKKLRHRFADNPDFAIETVRGLGYKAVFKEETT
jgi:DNA-binding response OmpR family regulator